MSFFDRRLDQPEPPTHPGNFFIDTWLARSNDGGATWRETRLSHDSWDPSINPPISPSGEFIGDYQGLVADNCFAIPFVNDTHLANDPARDPEFDHGFPRSPFQEVFSWRVPNNRAFGGDPRACRREGGPRPEPKPERPAERIRILSDRVHVEPGGFVPVRLRCPNRAPRACAGELDLRGFGRLGDLGHTHFRIQRGTTAEVTIRLSRDDFRTIKERRRVEVLARVVPDDRRVVAHNTRKLLTLVWRPARVSRLSSADRHAALDARIITEGDAIARKYGR